MTSILDRIRREPALVTGALSALIALLAAFGLDLSGEQTGAIMAITTALLAFVTRSQVTPTVSVGASESEPGAPMEAGPASNVKTGNEVNVVAADALAAPSQDYDGFGAPISDTEYVHDPKLDRP